MSLIKILGVTISNHLSGDVISKCVQSLFAFTVLRCHWMNNEALEQIYNVVVIAKLLYASPAWWGFATAAGKQRVEAIVRRGVRGDLHYDCDTLLDGRTSIDSTSSSSHRSIVGYRPTIMLIAAGRRSVHSMR